MAREAHHSPTIGRVKVGTGLLLGLAAGFTGGLFGVGGGVVMVPGLVLFVGLTQSRAHATSVTAIVAAASAGVVPLAMDDKVLWAAAGLVLIGSLVGAVAGARLVDRVSDLWLARAFLLLVIVAAIRMAMSTGGGSSSEAAAGALDISLIGAAGLILVGLFAGALAAILGIGGGIIFVPVLATLYAFPQHVAQATSLAVIVPTAAVAAAAHARVGRVEWRIAAILGLGGIAGGFLGATAALAIDGGLLRKLFAGFLVLMAWRMLDKTRKSAHPDPGLESH